MAFLKTFKLRMHTELERTKQKLAETSARLDDANQKLAQANEQLTNANKISEGQFKQLFDFMPQLGWTARPDGSIAFYNQGWHDYTGTAVGEADGFNWQVVHEPSMLPEITRRWQHSVDTLEPFEMQFPLRGANGKFRWFLTRVRPMFDEDGKVDKWIGINTDIEDARNAAEKLEQKVLERTAELEAARLEAVKANQLKSQFVANISHEIRTPMSGILGLSELLTLESQGDTQETARHIHNGARNLMMLVNDLLDLSKLEAGRTEIFKEPLLVTSVIDQVIEVFGAAASAKNLAVRKSISPDVMGKLLGDQSKVRQVLSNLVQNAIKFTEAGSVNITAALDRREADILFVRFAVQDTGPGISESDQKRLFQLFVQGDGSTTRKHGGTGLGLALSRRLVELMGGAIQLESTLGDGATFTFILPLQVIED